MEKRAFDLEKVYDEKINPLMAQIIEISKEHNLPFVATFQYTSEGEFCSSANLPKERAIAPPLEQIYGILTNLNHRVPPINLTVRDKDGNITQMTTILG